MYSCYKQKFHHSRKSVADGRANRLTDGQTMGWTDGQTDMGILAGQTFVESRKEDSDDNVDEPADYFDTEWHELQDNANLTEERFRAFWQDKHFKKAFKKFKTKFAK